MSLTWKHEKETYKLDPTGSSISILLDFDYENNVAKQPKHFGASAPFKTPMKAGSFIGDVSKGGSCNAFVLNFNVHCLATHTETFWHFKESGPSPYEAVSLPFYFGKLITVTPASDIGDETYSVGLDKGDLVITRSMLESQVSGDTKLEALIVRTLPNSESKKLCEWGKTCPQPFFTKEAGEYIEKIGIKHLIVDFPSVDKGNDDGHLLVHKTFLNAVDKTISEMAFISEDIADGIYGVSISVPKMVCDAAPSNIKLHSLEKIEA